MSTNKYFATLGDQDFVAGLKTQKQNYRTAQQTKGLRQAWKKTYSLTHGFDPNTAEVPQHGVNTKGDEDGVDYLEFQTGIMQPIIQQATILAIGERPKFIAQATSQDASSQQLTPLVGRLVEYCMKQCGFDPKLYQMTEAAVQYSEGLIHFSWDPTKGEPVNTKELALDPETGEPLVVENEDGTTEAIKKDVKKPSGQIRAQKVWPWQVYRDPILEESSWIAIDEIVNKHELASLYPQFEELILATQPPNHEQYELLGFTSLGNPDLVTLTHFYHRPTSLLPQGRYSGVVGDTVLWTRACPTAVDYPVVSIRPRTYPGTSIGHPSSSALLPLQEVYSKTMDSTASNMQRFKDQKLQAPSGVVWDEDTSLFTLPAGETRGVTSVDFAAIPPSVQWWLGHLRQASQFTMGLNDTAMGNPEGANMPGVAIATLTATATKLQHMLQVSIDEAIERAGNIVLELLKANAQDGLIADVAGKGDSPTARLFTAQELSGFKRVTIKRASPLLSTFAGIQELYNTIKEEPVDRQRQLVESFTTNSLEPLFEVSYNQTALIRWENEQAMQGGEVVASSDDDHKMHVPSHRAARDKLRMMPPSEEATQAILALNQHILSHAEEWLKLDPNLAATLGIPQAPTSAAMMPPPSPTPPTGGPTKSAAPIPSSPHPEMPQ